MSLTFPTADLTWPTPRASGPQWVEHDLSTWTVSDPAGLIDSASWGVASSVTPKTGIQAWPDAGKDGIWVSKALKTGVTWTDYAGILIRVSATSFGGIGSGVEARIGVGCMSTLLQATALGALGGLAVQSGGTRYALTGAIGVNPTSTTVNLGATTVFQVWCPFNAAGPQGAQVMATGASATEGRSLAAAPGAADLNVVLALGNSGNFSVAVPWSGLAVSTLLVPAAA